MNRRKTARGATFSLLAAALVALFASTGVSAAGSNSLEGVWSFNGGAVAIQSLADGTYQGTVVTTTTFASCPHPAGEIVWTGMKEQSDGSFWGLHQWYVSAKSCEPDATLGRTAWRVMTSASGARVLKVCFNSPSTGAEQAVQPKIAPGGQEEDVTFGCIESAPIAPLPVVTPNGNGGNGGGGSNGIRFDQTILTPSPKACLRRSSLTIRIKDPKYDPLKEIVLRIKGRKTIVVNGVSRVRKGVILRHLPGGTFTVHIVATTVLNQHLTGSRTYKKCSSTRRHGKSKRRKH